MNNTQHNTENSGARQNNRVSAFKPEAAGGSQADAAFSTTSSWEHLIKYLSAESPYRELSPNVPKDLTEEEIERVFYLDEQIKRSIERSNDIDEALKTIRNDHDQHLR